MWRQNVSSEHTASKLRVTGVTSRKYGSSDVILHLMQTLKTAGLLVLTLYFVLACRFIKHRDFFYFILTCTFFPFGAEVPHSS